ncbi:MAG: MATE family efflux transporter [Myxococcales bacterium]|nr:MATE family efflux transporter [Myxococcales bacterium]MCB9519786.1 MATE family efflux transporter [Myxococcales bacterium]MCB9530477.1 MATE family efflux transporter [Myxococcales bacterium]
MAGLLPTRERLRRIVALSLPIIGGMVSQNVVNLVDTKMVGGLGDNALAAVGMGGFANWLTMAFITGLAAGVQAMAARRLGEGRTAEMAVPLNGGLLQAMALGVPLTALAWALAPTFYPKLVDDPAVVALGVPYLRIRLLAITGIGMNFAFRGYWNGVNLSRLYMGTLVVMHLANICGNWLLIDGHLGFPALGVRGAAIASAASAYLGTAIYVGLALKHAREAGFLAGVPSLETMMTMARLAVPSGVQQLFFAAGMTTLFALIARIGTAELAVSQVITNLLLVAILPGIGFGLSAASLVGQALGRKEPDDAYRWGWNVALVAATLVGTLALPGVFWPEAILGFFVENPDTVALGASSLRIIALAMGVDAVGMVFMNAHFGAGAAGRASAISVGLQWLLFLPAVFVMVTRFHVDLTTVWTAQVIYRGLTMLMFVASWQQRGWVHAKA